MNMLTKKNCALVIFVSLFSSFSFAQSLSSQYENNIAIERSAEQSKNSLDKKIRTLQREVETRGTIIECTETTSSGNQITHKWGFIDSYALPARPNFESVSVEMAAMGRYTKTNNTLSWQDDVIKFEYNISQKKIYSQAKRGGNIWAENCTILKGNKF